MSVLSYKARIQARAASDTALDTVLDTVLDVACSYWMLVLLLVLVLVAVALALVLAMARVFLSLACCGRWQLGQHHDTSLAHARVPTRTCMHTSITRSSWTMTGSFSKECRASYTNSSFLQLMLWCV